MAQKENVSVSLEGTNFGRSSAKVASKICLYSTQSLSVYHTRLPIWNDLLCLKRAEIIIIEIAS